jgi:formate-dependent nitrite reductase membrane component NrfD
MPHETFQVIAVPDKPSDDGRNINAKTATLSGEAASQATLGTKYDVALQSKAFPYTPSQQPVSTPSYYDQPMLKEPVWEAVIPTYFYVGGVSGATAALAAAAQLIAPDTMRSLIKRGHWIGTIGAVVSAGLLIYDLGRPMRFINMLRVIRVTSPMSLGSWILSFFSTAIGAAAVLPYGPRIFRPLTSPFGVAAGVFGLGLAGYTGVLLAQTAVPVWQQSYRTLPILFISSGTAASAAVLEFFSWNEHERKTIAHFRIMGQVTELLTAALLERNASRVERVGRPLRRGVGGAFWKAGKLFTAAGIVLSLLPGKSRGKSIASGALGTAASLCTRFGIFYAGKASARDPRASFEVQRRTEPSA